MVRLNPLTLKYMHMAQEWANELGKLKNLNQQIVADETAWGFGEVEKGRNPDAVLKEILAKIREKTDAHREKLRLSKLHVSDGSDTDGGPMGPAAA